MPVQSLVTCEEFERLAAKLGPCELIDGEVRTLSPGGIRHSATSVRIAFILHGYASDRKLGHVLGNEVGIHVAQEPPRSRGADVAFISYKRLARGVEPEGFLTVAPELVVEVLGVKDTWKDMSEKIADYHRIGVDMVWVADPYTRTVKKFPRGAEPQIVHEGATIDGGAILPGFSAPVSKFFAD